MGVGVRDLVRCHIIPPPQGRGNPVCRNNKKTIAGYMTHLCKLFLSALLAATLAACGTLPRGAAIEREVTQDATTPDADIAVYPVTRAFLPSVAQWPRTGEVRHGWIGASRGPIAQVIRPGDRPDGLVWDLSLIHN